MWIWMRYPSFTIFRNLKKNWLKRIFSFNTKPFPMYPFSVHNSCFCVLRKQNIFSKNNNFGTLTKNFSLNLSIETQFLWNAVQWILIFASPFSSNAKIYNNKVTTFVGTSDVSVDDKIIILCFVGDITSNDVSGHSQSTQKLFYYQ